jgi:4-hydroxy-2-oxoheptanedioate aldolase
MNAAFDRDEPEFLAVLEELARQCTSRNMFAALHCLSPAYAPHGTKGFRFLTIGNDVSLIAAGAQAHLRTFRE